MAVDACPTTSQNTTKTHRNASIQHHSVHACTSIILHFVCILFAFFRLFPQSIYGTTPASETITLPLRRAPKSTYFFALVKPNEVKTCLQQGFATTKNPSRTLAKATSASLPTEIHKANKKTKTAGEKEKNKKKKKLHRGGYTGNNLQSPHQHCCLCLLSRSLTFTHQRTGAKSREKTQPLGIEMTVPTYPTYPPHHVLRQNYLELDKKTFEAVKY